MPKPLKFMARREVLLIGRAVVCISIMLYGGLVLFVYPPLSRVSWTLGWALILLPLALMVFLPPQRGLSRERPLLALTLIVPCYLAGAAAAGILHFNGAADPGPPTVHFARQLIVEQDHKYEGRSAFLGVFEFQREGVRWQVRRRVPNRWVMAGAEHRAYEVLIGNGAAGIPWVYDVRESSR